MRLRLARSANKVIMKRTKQINKARFRKRIIGVSLSVILLAGCEQADQKVSLYQNVDQCVKSGQSAGQCTVSFNSAEKDAIKTAPKYQNSSDCNAEFNECRYSSTYSSWYPLMMGYMMGPNGSSQALYNNNGKYVDSAGNSFGRSLAGASRMTTKSALAPKSAVTSTTTRGGFGASVGRSSGG